MSRSRFFRVTSAAIAVALTAVVATSTTPGKAARDFTAPISPVSDTRLELLVLEVRNCSVCEVVRDQIHPFYKSSQRAKVAPMRFVDITSINELDLGLTSTARVMPTVVLMKDGREIDRLTGLTATDVYFETLNAMIDAAR